MNLIPVKTPFIVKKLFPNYVWDIPSNENVLYLTFDDGPTPEITDWTLNILKTYNAKATFFCIGNNIAKYPNIFDRIIKEAHSVGNHTFHHAKGWNTSSEDYVEEVLKTSQLMSSEFEVISKQLNDNSSPITPNSKLFRPPYGQITPSQGKSLIKQGYKIIMWDVISFDWEDSISYEKCYQNVISKARPGSIVVFHDSIKASEHMQYALPKVLDYFSKKGFEFRRIPE